MNVRTVILMCALLIFASGDCLNAAAVPIKPESTALNQAQTTGAIKLADAIMHNDFKKLPIIFTTYFSQGILLFENPTEALQLTETVDQAVKARLKAKGDKLSEMLQNQAGQRFSKIIKDSKEILINQQTCLGLGQFAEIQPNILHVAEYLPYDALVKWMRTSHEIYKTLLPELKKRFDIIKNWENSETIPVKLEGATGMLFSIAFSHDGTMLASEGDEQAIRIWDIQKQKQISEFNKDTDKDTSNVSFSPKSNKLAFSPNFEIASIWDIDKNEIIKTTSVESKIKCLAFSPDENTVAIGCSNGIIILWNIITDQKSSFHAHDSTVTSIAFSPDGRKFVSGADDPVIKLWKSNGELINTLAIERFTSSVAFSPDNETVAAADINRIILWNINNNKKRFIHETNVRSVAYSPDGLILAAGSIHKFISLRSIGRDNEIKILGTKDFVESVEFSPNGKLMASASGHTIQLWKAKSTGK